MTKASMSGRGQNMFDLSRPWRRWLVWMLWALLQPALLFSQNLDSPDSRVVLGDPSDIWALPSQARTLVHRVHLEGRVSYVDPLWHMLWLENAGLGKFLQLGSSAPDFKIGQHVLIEGTIIPDQGLRAETVKVSVLSSNDPGQPIAANGRIDETEALDSRMVTLDVYVDSQQDIDSEHLRLNTIVDGRPVIAWLRPDNYPKLPQYQGQVLRINGLYSRRFDPSSTNAYIEIWIGSEAQVQPLYPLADDPHFALPSIPISQLYSMPLGTVVRIRGLAQKQDLGTSLTLRDSSGQVELRTCQRQRVSPGTELEVLGVVARPAGICTLDGAMYRKPALGTLSSAQVSAGNTPLMTVEQIRSMSAYELTRGRSVSVAGTVSWSLPEQDFFFLQDVSGGIRVHFSREIMSAPPLAKALQLEAVTRLGSAAPELELKSYRDLGAMNPPKPKSVGYEQAMTGKQDGQWVSMRGFLRRVVSDNDWHWIHVTTPSGDFVAHIQSPVRFVANVGSLIRIQGVCETTLNDQGQVSGVMLRVPYLHDISVEEDAPRDLFDLPLRPIQSLALLALDSDLMRVRISGVVTQCKVGEYVQVQEENAGVFLLCSGAKDLVPGDLIECVGILGTEGLRPVLREATYRKLGVGQAPAPTAFTAAVLSQASHEGLLVSVEGTLIDSFDRLDRTRLMLQDTNTIFEAALDRWPGRGPLELPELGSRLRLTGICRLEYDDAHRVRGFSLRLRNAGDIVVVEPARLLTQERALVMVLLLAVCTLLSFAWVYALRRRVRWQTDQLRLQLEHQQRLEAGVLHAARLESLGLMAGGIAHDFNNLLTVIMGNLGLAMVNPEGARAVGEHLKDAMKGATRARELTQQLLTFASGGQPIKTEVSLAELVLESTKSLLHGTPIRCDFSAQSGLWSAHVDRKQIGVVIQNVLNNAIQAMPKGGTLKISLMNQVLGEQNPQNLKPGPYLVLSFGDSGEGIASEVLPRIFDPYFSTRKGRTGLGLAAAYSIIKRHDGHIGVSSLFGSGTTCTLYMPALMEVEAKIEPSAAPAPVAVPATGARVLLMDDEESIRRIGSIVLRRLGLEVSLACDGEEAMRLFSEARAASRPFELIILDLTIPGGMGGKDTMEAIRQLDPNVPSIVSSGYSSDPVMADFKKYGFSAMVPKPYEVDQLSDAIQGLLAQRISSRPKTSS